MSNLCGVLTDGDIRRSLTMKRKIQEMVVQELMTENPVTGSVELSVVDAHLLMLKNKINVLPIVSPGGQFLGHVNLMDFQSHLSPERIYPVSEDDDDNVVRHMSRYKFAASFIPKGSRLLDCACGSGYGSELLAEKAGSVLGIDRCSDAIDYARAHFDAPNIEFRQGDIGHLKFAQDSFDAVVSLETLEHVPRDVCESYLRNIVQWLKPGGILVCSSPMLRYSNGKPYVTNPYHINELPRDELIQMLEQHNEHLQLNYFHQKEDAFQPLLDEHTGFCVIVARKRVEAVANKQPEEALAHTRIAG